VEDSRILRGERFPESTGLGRLWERVASANAVIWAHTREARANGRKHDAVHGGLDPRPATLHGRTWGVNFPVV